MKCENCGKEHDGKYGSGRFCNVKCARGFATKIKRKEINEKVSKKLIKYWDKVGRVRKVNKKIFICKDCGKYIGKTKHGYCKKCLVKTNIFKKICKQAAQKNIDNGTHRGWQSRNIKSYPEKFFIEVLKNNDLYDKCIVEYPIKKSLLGINKAACYFLDFYFSEINLDLEIDGKQHEYNERKKSDKIRDKLLELNGIKVYRIKWKSINTDKGKEYIKNEINKFLEYYKYERKYVDN